MKRNLRCGAVLLLLSALLLCGCGSVEPDTPRFTPEPSAEPTPEPTPEPTQDPMDLEDAAIRSAMEQEGFGLGNKLAVYLPHKGEAGQYSFHGAYLPEELRAESPEEIGAILTYYTTNERDGTGCLEKIRLEGAYSLSTGTALSTYGLKSGDYDQNFSSEWYEWDKRTMDLVDGGVLFTVYDPELQDYVDRSLDEWLELRLPKILQREQQLAYLNQINEQPETIVFGEGDKIIGYDEDADLYTMQRVAWELQASNPEETGYILSYHSTWETDTAYYQSYRIGGGMTITPHEVPVEICHVRFLSASTGQELVSFQTRSTPSVYAEDDAGIAKGQLCSSSGIIAKMQEAFAARGLAWLYPEIFPENFWRYGLGMNDRRDTMVNNPLGKS